MKDKRRINIPPNPRGSPIINIVCSVCGKYFSERHGHSCEEIQSPNKSETLLWDKCLNKQVQTGSDTAQTKQRGKRG